MHQAFVQAKVEGSCKVAREKKEVNVQSCCLGALPLGEGVQHENGCSNDGYESSCQLEFMNISSQVVHDWYQEYTVEVCQSEDVALDCVEASPDPSSLPKYLKKSCDQG